MPIEASNQQSSDRERLRYERCFFDSVSLMFTDERVARGLSARLKWELWIDVFRELEPLKNKVLLDLGCGLGLDSVALSLKGSKVVGLDISSESIKKAKKLIAKLGLHSDFVIGSVEKLPFTAESFDMAFGRGPLHHVNIEGCLCEVKRVVRDKCLFIEPLALNPIVNVNRYLLDKYDRTPYEKPLKLSEALAQFRRHYRQIRHNTYYLTSPASNIFKKLVKSDFMYTQTYRVLNKLDRALLKRVRALEDWCWIVIVVAKKY